MSEAGELMVQTLTKTIQDIEDRGNHWQVDFDVPRKLKEVRGKVVAEEIGIGIVGIRITEIEVERQEQ